MTKTLHVDTQTAPLTQMYDYLQLSHTIHLFMSDADGGRDYSDAKAQLCMVKLNNFSHFT